MLIHLELPSRFQTMFESMPERRLYGRIPVDVIGSENGTIVHAEVPGVSKEDISLSLEEDILTISGSRREKEITGEARVHLHEQRTRSFERRIRVPHPVDSRQISAALENGILTVTMPKAEEARPRTIEIK